MCLIVFAWKTHPDFELLVAANRDEFHERPTQAMHWWDGRSNILAGRDLQAGGTWFAISQSGRFGAVTNYREQPRQAQSSLSRGEIVSDFVSGDSDAENHLRTLVGDDFAGFNALTSTDGKLCYRSNRGDATVALTPGIYGLGNASLDTPWSKLVRTREALGRLLEDGDVNEGALMRLMSDQRTGPTDEIEAGPLALNLQRALTAPFVVSPDYGTRCTTVLQQRYDGEVSICERRFDPDGNPSGESRFSFTTSTA